MRVSTEMLKYLRAMGIWSLPPLAIFAFPTEAPGLTCLAVIYMMLAGLVLALAFFIKFFRTREKPMAATAFFMVGILWFLWWQYGFTLSARLHLFVNQGRYEKIINELSRAKSGEEKARICGERCLSSADPIIVFHYCHCFLNWPDLVYDPTGSLDGPPHELRKINLYLHDSRRLSKFWYIGYFGD